MNIIRDIAGYAVSTPEAPALELPHRVFSYAALDRALRALSGKLRILGVQPGDRVALTLGDEGLMALMFFALARMGATSVSIGPATPEPQRLQWMSACEVRCGFIDAPGLRADAAPLHHIGWDWFDETLAQEASWDDADLASPEAPLMIVVGSGSTGKPRLIPITHAQMRFRAESINAFFDMGPRDRVATMARMELAAGVHRLVSALLIGSTFVVLDRQADAARALREMQKLTVLTMSVIHLQGILALLPPGSPRLLDHVQLLVSASIVSPQLRSTTHQRLSRRMWVPYGTNETWMVSAATPEDSAGVPGTIGRPLPGVEVAIVDASGAAVPAGTIGFIRIRSSGTIDGYLQDAPGARPAFCDGWFMPNDLGRFTPEGQLVFCGRADDMMIFNGINISPGEIEQCLLSHPGVQEAVAMPLPHPIHQDVPACVVALRSDDPPTHAQLMAFARDHLGVRMPRHLLILDRIPRTFQGKPARAEILALLQSAAAGKAG